MFKSPQERPADSATSSSVPAIPLPVQPSTAVPTQHTAESMAGPLEGSGHRPQLLNDHRVWSQKNASC